MPVLHERMNAGKVMTSRSPRFMSPWKAVGRVHTKPHHGRGAGHVRSNVEPRWRSGRKCGAGAGGGNGPRKNPGNPDARGRPGRRRPVPEYAAVKAQHAGTVIGPSDNLY